MRCKIAGLIVEVPTVGGMASRCEAYRWDGSEEAQVTIRADQYRFRCWPTMDENDVAYMESGIQFYIELLRFQGLMLHASAVAWEGRAYLFSGPCGMGKSTHSGLWRQTFGDAAQVFNDDKPALRLLDGCWYAYGTPWCGKDGINQNKKVPLGGICFLEQGEENHIVRLDAAQAVQRLLPQTLYRLWPGQMDLLLDHLDKLVRRIPIFLLENRPEEAAARLSRDTMTAAAEEERL